MFKSEIFHFKYCCSSFGIQNLIKELETNPNTLKDISSTNAKGQTRKINKSSIANIIQFLIQSEK